MKKVSVPTIFALMLCAGLSACALKPRPVATHEVWPDGKAVPINSIEIVKQVDRNNNPPPPPAPSRGGGFTVQVGGEGLGISGGSVGTNYQDHNRFNMRLDW